MQFPLRFPAILSGVVLLTISAVTTSAQVSSSSPPNDLTSAQPSADDQFGVEGTAQ